jgi:hypothetical protein
MQGAQPLTTYQREHVFYQLPGLLEFFGFVFGFGNLLAGPVIEFRDYQMWVNSEGPWAPNAEKKVPWTGDMMAVRVPLSAAAAAAAAAAATAYCCLYGGSLASLAEGQQLQTVSWVSSRSSTIPLSDCTLLHLIATCLCCSLLCTAAASPCLWLWLLM